MVNETPDVILLTVAVAFALSVMVCTDPLFRLIAGLADEVMVKGIACAESGEYAAPLFE
jgi:hypothetical protein